MQIMKFQSNHYSTAFGAGNIMLNGKKPNFLEYLKK